MMWAIPAAMGALGALAGSMKDRSSQTSSVDLAPMGEMEKYGGDQQMAQLKALTGMVDLGPGNQDITNSLNSTRSLADMLSGFAKGGYGPSDADITASNDLAKKLFGARAEALNQNFQDAQVFGNRQAARMGRSANDPILLNKLLQEQTRQQAMLNAEQGAFAAQDAQSRPMRQLEFANQLAQVRGGLATQAMANRQALFGLGTQLKQQEQNFRLQSATRTTESEGGGGLKGALQGGIAGFGAGMGAAGMMSKMGMFSSSSGPGEIVANNSAASTPGLGFGAMSSQAPAPSMGINMGGLLNYGSRFQTAPAAVGPYSFRGAINGAG